MRPERIMIAALLFAAAGCGSNEFEAPAGSTQPLTIDHVDSNLAFARDQIRRAEGRLAATQHGIYTPTDRQGGDWFSVTVSDTSSADWRSGFFTGCEWLMHEAFPTGTDDWRGLATERTEDFTNQVGVISQTHDVGFKTLTTYGNAFRLTNVAAYREKIFTGANVLAGRYLPEYGITQSWDALRTNGVRVIIDNMMNLELLFLAAELTSDTMARDGWLQKAVSHARNTRLHHVRPDGSTFHVCYYARTPFECGTHQGLEDWSTWSRGQAWAVYGFTMAYLNARKYSQYTTDAGQFLETATRTADYFLRRLGESRHGDNVPLHDFDAPAGNPKDSSAAAIAAAALVDLSKYAATSEARAGYRAGAERILDDLRSLYRETVPNSNESILLRATTTYRSSSDYEHFERGLIYADYYFLEALLRYRDSFGPTPKAPTFLAATNAAGAVELSWTGTRGAAGYTVKRRQLPSGAWASLPGPVEQPRYQDTGVTVGQTYEYEVTATNFATPPVESPGSNRVVITPVLAPALNSAVIPSTLSPAGSFSQNGDVITMSASGSDIWGVSDQFRFAYQTLVGDGSITARVAALCGGTPGTCPNGWTKAGVMMRDGLAAGARNVAAVVSPTATNKFRFQRRATAGSSTVGTASTANSQVPAYLRLTRDGNNFSASYSLDGVSYTPIGTTQTIALPSTLLVGIAVTSHAVGALATATFDGVVVSSATPTPPPPPTNLVATAGDQRVDLTWTGSAGATSYTVKRADAPGGPYTALTPSPTETRFTDTTVANGSTYDYVVVANNAAGSSDVSNQVSATPGATPAWTSEVIPADLTPVGSFQQVGDTFTVEGAGTDIWGTADAFRFAYRQMTGDVTITARVTSLENTNAFAKAGVMMRDGNGRGARNLFMFLTPTAGNGYRFQRRLTDGGDTTREFAGSSAVPSWIRIVRSGNTFRGYYSSNGTSWTQVGAEVNVTLPSTLLVGLAITSHAAGDPATAEFQGVELSTPGLPAPAGLMAAPSNGQVRLTWNAVSGASEYIVQRALTAGGPYTALTPRPIVPEFLDTGLPNGTPHFYVVAAATAAQPDGGPNSVEVSATPNGSIAPAAPENLDASVTGGNQVNLTWEDRSNNEAGFRVERKVGTGSYASLATKPVDATSHPDPNLTPNTYTYRVIATGSPDSAPSNEAMVMISHPAADAYVRSGTYASTNFGTGTVIDVKTTTSANTQRNGFLRFALSGLGATVSSAKLRLYGHAATSAKATSVFPVASIGWAESGTGGLIWNNQPAMGASALATQSVGTADTYVEWDLTAYVQAQRTAGAAAVSLGVRSAVSSDEGQTTFHSREGASKPLLVVSSR